MTKGNAGQRLGVAVLELHAVGTGVPHKIDVVVDGEPSAHVEIAHADAGCIQNFRFQNVEARRFEPADASGVVAMKVRYGPS